MLNFTESTKRACIYIYIYISHLIVTVTASMKGITKMKNNNKSTDRFQVRTDRVPSGLEESKAENNIDITAGNKSVVIHSYISTINVLQILKQ